MVATLPCRCNGHAFKDIIWQKSYLQNVSMPTASHST